MSNLIETMTNGGATLFIARDKIVSIVGKTKDSCAIVECVNETDQEGDRFRLAESVESFVRKYKEGEVTP